ncbi:MAG: hypothetical protein ACKOF7_09615, partial [Phycisphaerales bacterium]
IRRRALARAGRAHDEAGRIGRETAERLSARRRLIGNRFAPSMDPSRLRPASDPADMDAALAHAGLPAAIDREFARAESLRQIARGLAANDDARAAGQAALADSRARSAERRVSAIVEQAVDRATVRTRG